MLSSKIGWARFVEFLTDKGIWLKLEVERMSIRLVERVEGAASLSPVSKVELLTWLRLS